MGEGTLIGRYKRGGRREKKSERDNYEKTRREKRKGGRNKEEWGKGRVIKEDEKKRKV